MEVVVAGAGVIGLATARALALAGMEVLVLEAESAIGSVTSSRSSEVIHAGLYYPPGSLKAVLCVEARERLYRYCAEHGVAAPRLGMVVAAEDGELPALEAVARRAAANGVADLEWLDGAQVRALEPALSCVAALLSPSTGIVDSHGLMLAYQGDAEAAGRADRLPGSDPAGRGRRGWAGTRHRRRSGDAARLSLVDQLRRFWALWRWPGGSTACRGKRCRAPITAKGRIMRSLGGRLSRG
ncbi:MAG: FAD-dependent oxidoreductase [Aliidongia sp.]